MRGRLQDEKCRLRSFVGNEGTYMYTRTEHLDADADADAETRRRRRDADAENALRTQDSPTSIHNKHLPKEGMLVVFDFY